MAYEAGQVAFAASSACKAPTTSIINFTNTFILSSAPNEPYKVLEEIPKALDADPSRQRRAHQKSKTGCANCRQRRVKCSEEVPCANCTRRGERCYPRPRGRYSGSTGSNSSNGTSSASLSPTSGHSALTTLIPSSRLTNDDAPVNLLHMKLLHHFQLHTCKTLMLGPPIWNDLLQLCFQFDFLMDAVLCVAARHLTFLQPADNSYSKVASACLCRALPKFRQALSDDFTSNYADAFVVTALLLQYEVWASTDYFCTPKAIDYHHGGNSSMPPPPLDPSRDRIIALGSGLKQALLKSVPVPSAAVSLLGPQLRRNTPDILMAAARISTDTLAGFRRVLSYHRPLDSESLALPPARIWADGDLAKLRPLHVLMPEDPVEAYELVVTRLSLILAFLPEARPPAAADGADEAASAELLELLPDLARYIFTLPMLCYGPVVSMVEGNDPHVVLLLYHFYRAVRILLPSEQYWWAHKRATVSEAALKSWLMQQCPQEMDTCSLPY
ncbi:hypothetical protein BX600DRAFT_514729 [Xylariales sp. PMI_506]|nr:hypothetical protein BX600DRAFT_514729 [Xylariales sp. PMI_506]